MARKHLSAHPQFDDLSHYFFARTSGLPRGYFDRPRTSRLGRVVIVALVMFVVGALAAWARP